MYEPVPTGEPGQFPLFPVGVRVEVADGQHHQIGDDRLGLPLQPHLLAAVGRAADPGCARPVPAHG